MTNRFEQNSKHVDLHAISHIVTLSRPILAQVLRAGAPLAGARVLESLLLLLERLAGRLCNGYERMHVVDVRGPRRRVVPD